MLALANDREQNGHTRSARAMLDRLIAKFRFTPEDLDEPKIVVVADRYVSKWKESVAFLSADHHGCVAELNHRSGCIELTGPGDRVYSALEQYLVWRDAVSQIAIRVLGRGPGWDSRVHSAFCYGFMLCQEIRRAEETGRGKEAKPPSSPTSAPHPGYRPVKPPSPPQPKPETEEQAEAVAGTEAGPGRAVVGEDVTDGADSGPEKEQDRAPRETEQYIEAAFWAGRRYGSESRLIIVTNLRLEDGRVDQERKIDECAAGSRSNGRVRGLPCTSRANLW
jgi:hypothetical protein